MDVAPVLFWEVVGSRNLVFFRVRQLRPEMKGTVCVCVFAHTSFATAERSVPAIDNVVVGSDGIFWLNM